MINYMLREMKDMKKLVLTGLLFLMGTITLNASDNADGKEAVDTTYTLWRYAW